MARRFALDIEVRVMPRPERARSGGIRIQRPLMLADQNVVVKPVQERIGDAMREVGTLLITFAPLDAALSESRNVIRGLLYFLGIGLVLFAGSLWLERRRPHVD